MAEACNKPFVLVNEDHISELIKDSDVEDTKNTKKIRRFLHVFKKL